MVVTAYLHASIGSAKSQLRHRIIGTYQRAQRIIATASTSPPAKTHAMMIAYGRACEHLRADISQAGRLFPHTEALLAWLLEALPDEVMPEQDRISFALTIGAMKEEVDERRKAS
jgi:hypothetical protein